MSDDHDLGRQEDASIGKAGSASSAGRLAATQGEARQGGSASDEFDPALLDAARRADEDEDDEDGVVVEREGRGEAYRPDDRVVVAAGAGAIYEEAAIGRVVDRTGAESDGLQIGRSENEHSEGADRQAAQGGELELGSGRELSLAETADEAEAAADENEVEQAAARAVETSGAFVLDPSFFALADEEEPAAAEETAPQRDVDESPETTEPSQEQTSAAEEEAEVVQQEPPAEPPNEAPSDITLSASSVAENADGAVVGQLGVLDPDSAGHSWSVDDARFEVVGGALKLKAGASLDFETDGGSVDVAVTVTDGDGLSFTETFSLTLQDQNDTAQLFTSGSSANAAESVNDSATIYTAAATDADTTGEAITFSLANDFGGLFEIDANTGEVSLAAGRSLDFETQDSYSLTIESSDGFNNSAHIVTLTVDDVAEATNVSGTFVDAGAAETSITGSAGADDIAAHDDGGVIDGGAGDDVLRGGAGNDALTGGAGTDAAVFSGNYAAYSVAYDGASDTFTLTGPDGADTVTGVENFEFADQTVTAAALQNAAGQTLTGTGGDDAIAGGTGDDSITGGAGDDAITGGAGTDAAIFSGNYADYAVSYDGPTDTFTLVGPDGTDTVTGVENFQFDDQTVGEAALRNAADQNLVGTGGVDAIAGGTGDDTIAGQADDDAIAGGAGDDAIDGGAGTDTAVFSGDYAGYAVSYNAATDTFTLVGPDGTDTVTGVENFQFDDQTVGEAALQAAADQILGGAGGDDTIAGGTGDDAIDGEAGADTLDGGAGDDAITGGAGDDAITGGAGTDTAIFSGNYADYTVSYDGPTDTFTLVGPDGTDTVTGVENFQFDDQTVGEAALRDAADQNLVGTAGVDALTGGTGDDAIAGGADADTLDGGAGDDVLTGGAGDDAIDGGAGAGDVAVFSGNWADYTITENLGVYTVVHKSAGADGADTVTGVETFRFADGDVAAADVLNDGPTGGDDVAAINEDAVSVGGDVLSNDADPDAGDSLSVVEVGGQAGDVGAVVAGAHGSITINADGSYAYSLDNADAAVQALNVGDSITDSFTYTVTDAHGAADAATLTITINGTNDAPEITSDGGGASGAVAINEGQSAVTTVTSSDVDAGATATYAIAGGADAALFQIDPNTGALSFIVAPSFEDVSADADDVYEVTVQVTDDNGATDTQTLSVTVDDINNQGQVFTSGNSANAAEGVNDSTTIYTATATDADTTGEAITFSLTDDAGGLFEIDANTGVVTLATGQSLDYETATSHDITIRSSDGTNTTDKTITINVTDVNEAPTAPSFTQATTGVTLNTDGGNDAYLSIHDDGGRDLVGGRTAFTIETAFAIDNSQGAVYTPLFSYHTGGASDEIELSVNHHSAYGVAFEMEIGGQTVIVSGYDAMALLDGNDHQVSLTWDNASGDWEIYVDGASVASGTGLATGHTIVDGGEIVFGQEQDAEDGGYNSTQFFAGTLYDVRIFDDVRTAQEIADNTFTTIDPATSGLLANWTMDGLDGGAVADTVSGADLELEHASGGGFVASTPADFASLSEGAQDGMVVGAASVSDPESGALTYSLTDDAGGRFAIDASTGEITVADASLLDYESATSHDITIQVSDGTHTVDQTVTINVEDVNEVADDIVVAGGDADHSGIQGDVVATVSATDPEGQAVSFSIASDPGGYFDIDPNTGAISLTAAGATYFTDGAVESAAVGLRATDTGGAWAQEDITVHFGSSGDDAINGGAETDVIYGGAGEDTITGGDGDDVLYGGDESGGGAPTGPNLITNGGFENTSTGWTLESGPAFQFKNSGDHGVSASEGSHYLDMEEAPGNVSISQTVGGLNNGDSYQLSFDTAQVGGRDAQLQVYWNGQLIDTITPNSSTMSSNTYSVVAGSGDGSDKLTFTEVGAEDMGGTGVDNVQLFALDAGGGDTIDGGAGDDVLIGGAGADSLDGGAGNDTVDYSSAAAGVDLAFQNVEGTGIGGAYANESAGGLSGDADGDSFASIEAFVGTGYADKVYGGAGDMTFALGDGDDVFDTADAGAAVVDTVYAGDGDDLIWTGEGADLIYGGAGADTIEGEGGDDTIYGGEGDDWIEGGDGSDLIIAAMGDGDDTIIGGAGGGWTDTIELQDASGGSAIGTYGVDWTVSLTTGTIDAVNADSLDFSDDAGGTITLSDGTEITFSEIEQVQW